MTEKARKSITNIKTSVTERDRRLFAMLLESGKTVPDAYAVVRPEATRSTCEAQGYVWSRRADVVKYREEIRGVDGVKPYVRPTVESITQELEQARLLAIRTGQAAAAVSATAAKMRLHGLEVAPRENLRSPYSELSARDLKRMLRQLSEKVIDGERIQGEIEPQSVATPAVTSTAQPD